MLSIHYVPKTEDTYDITVEGNHNFFANDVLVHNCVEICLPTEPIRNTNQILDVKNIYGEHQSITTHEGLVQLCILGAINTGSIDLDNTKDIEERYDVLVVFLNELIDYQEYLVPQSQRATILYRPLGIGVVNFAYFLAKRNLSYNDPEALNTTHRLAEQMYYFALKASCKYAQYKGSKVPGYDELIYSDGKTLLDTYCKRVDELTNEKLHMDWKTLKADIKEHGIYNSTFGAFMPSESSSTILSATSGFDPIRSIITSKKNKRISFKQVAPEPIKLKNQYDMLWDMVPSKLDGYIKVAAVFQKFLCQSMSTNFSYNPDHFQDGKVPITAMMNHTFLAAKYGLKTRYYVNTKGEGSSDVEKLIQQQSQQTDLPDLQPRNVEYGSPVPVKATETTIDNEHPKTEASVASTVSDSGNNLSMEELTDSGCESGACAI